MLASFLLCQNCRLLGVEKTGNPRATFVFQESEERKILTDHFITYKAMIEPHKFFYSQRDLKQLLYSP